MSQATKASNSQLKGRPVDMPPVAQPEASTADVGNDIIANRAYELYERRGGKHGHDWEDWFQAERELQTKTTIES